MSGPRLSFAILGLSVTSSWGNGHATTYRGLVRELVALGHDVLFLERDVPWYAANRDLPELPWGRTALYGSLDELADRHGDAVRHADVVIVGSYVPDGIAVAEWALERAEGAALFYDIDTPVTLEAMARRECSYLTRALVPRFDLYLSFTGGPTLRRLERELGARCALPLYCAVDPQLYFPEAQALRWDLGYLGTYSGDRQRKVESLLLEPARRWPEGRFALVGAQYPAGLSLAANVHRSEHLPPGEHRAFFNRQRFTLNVTRAAMIEAGFSPSVRLFEAGACAVPVVSDPWAGLEHFFRPDHEVLVAERPYEVLRILRDLPESRRRQIGQNARRRVLAEHTAAHRAATLERYARNAIAQRRPRRPVRQPRPFSLEAAT